VTARRLRTSRSYGVPQKDVPFLAAGRARSLLRAGSREGYGRYSRPAVRRERPGELARPRRDRSFASRSDPQPGRGPSVVLVLPSPPGVFIRIERRRSDSVANHSFGAKVAEAGYSGRTNGAIPAGMAS
jgi:hypothetical protein